MATAELEQNKIQEPRCGKCGGKKLYRSQRWGVWQTHVLPRFGLFPWKCASCKKTYYLRLRAISNDPISDW